MLSFTNFVLAASVLAVAAGQASAASIQPRSSISATTFQYGGTYLGCYTDSSSRVLNGQSFTSSTQMTIEACANACGLYNYRYAGVEYGSECYCGNTAPKSSLALSDSKCSTYTCPGNSTETCGGYYALQAYDNTYLAPGYSSTTSSSSTSTASSTSTTSTSKSTSTSSTSTSSTSTSTSSTSTSSSSTSTSTAKTSTTSTASSTSTASTSTVTSTAKTSTSTTSTATSSTAAAKATYSYSGAALGCFQDNAGFGGSRTLNAYTFSATNMTLESCANTCGSQNYKYAGTEYANQCWCDNVLPTNSSTSCNMACAGDATETCGGSWALSVVDNKAITAPVVAATTQIVVASTYGASNLGCFVDNLGTGGARTLGAYSVSASNMTNEICANTCGAQGWKYSGVEYGQECFCGATLPTNSSTACTMPCAGNSGETCGGSWALSVFDNTAISSTGNLASNYNSLGCYLDSTSARTLASYSYTSSSMTISTCAAKCSSLNYAFSGVEYGQECYCGNVAPAVTSTACTMSCAGSNSQICGGSNALSIVRDTSISATSATCSGLPSGYVACMEGQKVSGGVCVAA